jgi:anti-sigma B factor antagonist
MIGGTPELPLFEIATTYDGGISILSLSGELDLATASTLREHLVTALNGGATEVICDLEGVTFMDSTALSVLISGHRKARAAGIAFALLAPQPQVDRLLDISGLKSYMTVRPKTDDITSVN